MRRRYRDTYDSRYEGTGGLFNHNPEYYGSGTMFDRVGARMATPADEYIGSGYGRNHYGARSPRRRRGPTGYERDAYSYKGQNNVYDRGYYEQDDYDYRMNPNVNRANSASYSNLNQDMYAQQAEDIVYDSVIPTGVYHNLDNPKNDIKNYPERSNNEE